MVTYTPQVIEQLEAGRSTVQAKYASLLDAYAFRQYKCDLAREMAVQGFCRRLRILVHCIDRVFATIPPFADDIPLEDDRTECEIAIHSFVMNVFGCMDNLANTWVKERGVLRPNGKSIPPILIGLSEKCADVRSSLSEEFQAYLQSDLMREWFDYFEGYRHALVHRIPLYIPPYSVPEDNTAKYQELEQKKFRATMRGDTAEHDRLDGLQMKLCSFQAIMTHSWEEKPPVMYFHAQVLTDYETIVDLAWRMDRELKG